MTPPTNISFEDQRHLFIKEMSKAFDYIVLEEVHVAQSRMFTENRIIDDDLMTFMMHASYIGSLKRITYYKYVHRFGFDVRALADACVMVLMFGGVYKFDFEPYLKDKEVKAAMKKTPYPAWTKLGLIGGSTKELSDLGKEFSEYLDNLKEDSK